MVKLTRFFRISFLSVLLLIISAAAWGAPVHPTVRIKDLADVQGVRSNQLVGVGIVMGLQGTGDKGTMATQMIRNLMSQFGVTLDDKAVKTKNVAVVTLTATLPPFARPGQTIDVTASTMGDAKSLQGGTLLQVPLKGADGNVYAVAQGPLLVGGFAAAGAAGSVAKNIVTVGRIPGGAIVERDVETDFVAGGTQVNLLLKNPDFTTSERMAGAINAAYKGTAWPVDAGRVVVAIPAQFAASPSAFIARVDFFDFLSSDRPRTRLVAMSLQDGRQHGTLDFNSIDAAIDLVIGISLEGARRILRTGTLDGAYIRELTGQRVKN